MLHVLYRYANWIFFCYMGGAAVFLLLIESVFNGGFAQSIKWLWLPLAVLIFGFTWLNRYLFHANSGSSRQSWLFAFILYPVVLLLSWPYVMALNAATASGDTMTYRGPVVQKRIDHSRRYGDSYQIELQDTRSTEIITLTVPPARYSSLSVGDVTTEEFLRGGLGILFRWRFTKR
jgi:hypothetical protein